MSLFRVVNLGKQTTVKDMYHKIETVLLLKPDSENQMIISF